MSGTDLEGQTKFQLQILSKIVRYVLKKNHKYITQFLITLRKVENMNIIFEIVRVYLIVNKNFNLGLITIFSFCLLKILTILLFQCSR